MSVLNAPATIEKTVKLPIGRVPIMAFLSDAATESVVHECLSQLSMSNAVLLRGGIAGAIQHLAAERSPNFLIVDVSDVDLPVSQIHALAEVCEPGVSVIAIGKRNDVGLYRDLLHAGVSDYIVKPLTPHVLANALRIATNDTGAAPISQKVGKLIAFSGARGGVGTTTVAVTVARYLSSQQGRRVALVDLDLHNGDCGLSLDIKPTPGLREALANPLRIDSVLIERAMTPIGDRLFVLSSEAQLYDDVDITASAVDALVSALRQQFHYVILDVPRVRSAPYHRALDIADIRVLVLDQTLRSVRDVARWQGVFEANGSEGRNLLVVNRAGEGGRRAVPMQDLREMLKVEPKYVVPFDPKHFAFAALGPTAGGKVPNVVARLALDILGQGEKPRRWWRFGS